MDASMMAGTQMPDDLYADHGYKLIVTTVVSFILATAGIVGRFAARLICQKRLEANDYLITAGYVFKLSLTILSSCLIAFGIGRHIFVLDPSQVTSYLKGVYTGSFMYAPTVTFIKLSILSLYYAAFPSRFMKLSFWTVGGVVVAWCIAICLTGLMTCLPIHKAWDPTIPGHCINQYRYYYGLQIPNIITDFIIVFLPFKEIYDLHLPVTQLVQIGGILALGLVTCAFDIIRLVVFVRMPQVLDQTWVNLPPSMWLDLEVSVALLCACLPVMRPLLAPKKFWRNNRGSNRMTSGGSNSPDGKEKMMLEERTPERDAHSSSTTEDSGKIV